MKKEGIFLCALFYMVYVLLIAGYAGSEETVGKTEISETRVTEAPRIALTFDDGPSCYTEELLDGLKARGVTATFFIIGQSAEEFPEVVKREAKEGHLIGNHTYSHVEITKLSDDKAREEIEKTNTILTELTGKPVEYIRPPFGLWQKKLEQEMDVMPVMWSVDPLDWTTKNVDEIVNKVVKEAEEDDIILLHDCYKSSVEAAFRIIDLLKAEGYEFVTADKLLLN